MSGRTLVRFLRELDPAVLSFNLAHEWKTRAHGQPARVGHALAPTAMYVETSSFCRDRCPDCYVPVQDRRRHVRLGDAILARLMAEARRLELSYVCLVGGEPLDEAVRDTNLRLVRDNPSIRFLICTGGRDISEPRLAVELGALRNLAVIVSIDGHGETHDRFRGKGSHAAATAGLSRLARSGRGLRGASVTLHRDSWEEATSEEFVRDLCGLGCHFLVFDACFTTERAAGLTSAEYLSSVRRLMQISERAPAWLYANPIGRLRGTRQPLARTMRPMTVDYRGNVYTTRRGPSLGNLHERDLAIMLGGSAIPTGTEVANDAARRNDAADPTSPADPRGPAGHAPGDDGGDPRAPMFQETLAALGIDRAP